MTKPTLGLVQPVKTQNQPAYPCSLRVLADCMCFLQSPSYPKKDEREPLVCWVDIQADQSLCWSHRSYCRFCHALVHIFLFLHENNTSFNARKCTFEHVYPAISLHISIVNHTKQMILFVLRFYGPVNPMGSCRVRSVYLTCLLGRLSPLSG